MALDNLRAFIGAIDAAGQLARVERPVSVDKEITEVADRCMKSPGGGPALLFTKPTLRSGAPLISFIEAAVERCLPAV